MKIPAIMTACVVLVVVSLYSHSGGQGKAEGRASQTVNMAHGPDYDVTVLLVAMVKGSPSSSPLHLVEYEYEFKGRSYVYISGLGNVAAKGRLKYFMFDRQIEFREAADGKIIVTVPVREIIVFGGPLNVDIPKETDFSPAVREGIWTEPPSFHDNAAKVLARYFPSGYVVLEKDAIDFYTTQYRQMDGIRDQNLIGEIAVVVSHPFKLEKGRFYFQVKYAARESRIKSSAFRPASQEVIRAAEDLIERLTKELQKTGGAQG